MSRNISFQFMKSPFNLTIVQHKPFVSTKRHRFPIHQERAPFVIIGFCCLLLLAVVLMIANLFSLSSGRPIVLRFVRPFSLGQFCMFGHNSI